MSAHSKFVPDPSWPSIVELAIERWGQPNRKLSKRDDIRFGSNGSKSVKASDNTWFDHEAGEGGGYVEMHLATRGPLPKPDGQGDKVPPWENIGTIYHYHDAAGDLVLDVVRTRTGTPRFIQRRPDASAKGGWRWSVKDLPGHDCLLYRLPGLRASGDATVFITEGEKDADRLHDEGLIATTNIGGAGKWRDEYVEEFRGKRCVMLADNDKAGRDHAASVARSLIGVATSIKVLSLPGLPDKGDVSDWLDAGGTVENLEQLARASPEEVLPPAPVPRGTRVGRLLVLSVADTDTATPRDYLMKGLISPGEISIWVGPPKCGKSFLLLYVAYMLSLGRGVFGRRVKHTKVLYVAAEGEAGIANRVRALRIRYGYSANFHFIAQPADLLHDAGHLAELKKAAQTFGVQLIVLDTLSRLLAGGDENSPIDMGCFVRNVAELRLDTGAHVAIVHHGTKSSNGSNPRGHSCLTGADDALIEVLMLDNGSRQATVIHAKDDADGMRWGFKLESVELGVDDDGDPITTLLTTEMAEPPPAAAGRGRLSDNLQIGMKTLHAAMKAHAIVATVGDDHSERSVITEADWRTWFYREGKPGESQDTKKKTFQRIVDGLLAKGKIGSWDGFIWPLARGL